MLEKLKALAPVAWALSIIHSVQTIQWALLMAASLAIVSGFWAWATHWGYLPIALSALIAFGAALWITNQLIRLRMADRPLRSRMAFDYSYGLALIGLAIARDEAKPEAFFQVGLTLQNSTDRPMLYFVEDMTVTVHDRTHPRPVFNNRGSAIASRTATTFYYPAFSEETVRDLPSRANGRITFSILYGHPEDSVYVRRVKKELAVSYRFDGELAAVYLLTSEKDEEVNVPQQSSQP